MKKLKFIYTIILFSLVFVSCKDFVERPPLDDLSVDEYWQTSGDLERYMLKFYPRAFPGHGTYGNASAYVEVNSDNMIGAQEGPNNTLNGTRGVTGGRWISDWDDIRSLNIFFENYQKVDEDISRYEQYLGEAHFFKAWFYFDLVKSYGDVPWYTEVVSLEDSTALYRSRDLRTEVVDSILTSLDKAITHVGYKDDVGNTRINKETALAFKTRVALFEGTWQKYHAGTSFGTEAANPDKYFQISVDAAEELINSNDYTKGIYNPSDTDNPYFELFGLGNMDGINEVLLYKAYNGNNVANDVQYVTKYNVPWGWGITWSLVSSYLDKEGKPYNYLEVAETTKGNDFLIKIADEVDQRLHATVWVPEDIKIESSESRYDKPPIDETGISYNPTGFWMKKGANPSSEERTELGGGNSDTGYIIFRYAEVLLNYAEAKYELDNEVAYNALNLLRERSDMPDFSVIPMSSYFNLVDYGYPVSDALYAIRKERRVELAIENHRDEDYRRWAAHSLFKDKQPKGYPFKQSEFPQYDPPLDENGLIEPYQNTLSGGYNFRPDRDYLDPIPSDEISINPNIEQNPGW